MVEQSFALYSRLDLKKFQSLITSLIKYLYYDQNYITPTYLAEQLYSPFQESDLQDIYKEIKCFEMVLFI